MQDRSCQEDGEAYASGQMLGNTLSVSHLRRRASGKISGETSWIGGLVGVGIREYTFAPSQVWLGQSWDVASCRLWFAETNKGSEPWIDTRGRGKLLLPYL